MNLFKIIPDAGDKVALGLDLKLFTISSISQPVSFG